MPPSDTSPGLPFSSPTRGAFQGLRLLCLLAALGLMAVQLAYAYAANLPTHQGPVPYYPAIVAAVLFAGFLLLGRSHGVIHVARRRIHGRRSMGVAFDIPIAAVTQVELRGKRLAIKGANDQLLLIESPKDARIAGLIWLCWQYHDWPDAIWNALELTETTALPRCTRYFLDADGTPAFGDHGFTLQFPGQMVYLPATAMFPIPGRPGDPNRLHARPVHTGGTLIQFEPRPDSLPVAAWCAAIAAAGCSPQTIAGIVETLQEVHGGNLVTATGPDTPMSGDCMGYAVRIVPA